PYSPLHGGFLTGKYERVGENEVESPDGSRGDIDEHFEDWYLTDEAWDVLDEIRAVADEADATPAQVSLRWLMDQPGFTCVPIVGARTTDQLAENVGAVDVELTDEQFARIDDAMEA
ncbi:MAG: aldo/keto reductase, partial [Haloarculaceae archaeon]